MTSKRPHPTETSKSNAICRREFALLMTLGALLLLPGALQAQTVTIYRDKFGVPSVVADRLPDAIYGLGYAMAQDNAEQMARNFKQARGRRAEVDGRGFRRLRTEGVP